MPKKQESNARKAKQYMKKRAKGRNLECSLSTLPPSPDICPVLGIPINYETYGLACSPTFDRIDSAIGYVDGNVRIISYRANRLRSNATFEESQLIAADALKFMEWSNPEIIED